MIQGPKRGTFKDVRLEQFLRNVLMVRAAYTTPARDKKTSWEDVSEIACPQQQGVDIRLLFLQNSELEVQPSSAQAEVFTSVCADSWQPESTATFTSSMLRITASVLPTTT